MVVASCLEERPAPQRALRLTRKNLSGNGEWIILRRRIDEIE
jgi:hypothetical protein